MNLIINFVGSNMILDNYDYSLDKFVYNDKILKVQNPIQELIHLISMVSNWDNTTIDSVKDGVEVIVEVENSTYKYVFENASLPSNFMSFMHEVKRLIMEV